MLTHFHKLRWEHGDEWEKHIGMRSEVAPPIDLLFSAATHIEDAGLHPVRQLRAMQKLLVAQKGAPC